MPQRNQAALDFLLTRRSRPARTLAAPVPDRAELRVLLTAAARVPDHGKLEPWRFVVLEQPALARLATEVAARGAALGHDADKLAKDVAQYAEANLVVAVIASPKASEKAPPHEQAYSTGAVCLSLVNAALAAGWGASWLTGWASTDAEIATRNFALQQGESVAGLIHIGTETTAPPERPRPDIDAITSWVES